jgi:hypothetical protein
MGYFEASPWQATGKIHRKEVFHFQIRSLTQPQAAGNALAFAVEKMPLNEPLEPAPNGAFNSPTPRPFIVSNL